MSNDNVTRKTEEIQKGRAMPSGTDPARMREGYTMPAQPTSRGPVSQRPGSALPPKPPPSYPAET